MNALVRYALMKGMRDGIILPLLFGPALLFVSPLLVTAAFRFFTGGDVWPMSIPGAPPGTTVHILTLPAILSGTVSAGVAAFWIFRQEMAGRTMGFFLLAQPARVPATMTMLFGTVMGTAGTAVSIGLIALLTESRIPMDAAKALSGVAAIAIAAALGTLAVGMSGQLGILLPGSVVSVAATAHLLTTKSAPVAAAGIAVAVAITIISVYVWRRLCPI